MTRLPAAVHASLTHFAAALRRYPWVAALLLLLWLVKVGANVTLGANPGRMLLTQSVGFLAYGLAVLTLDALHYLRHDRIIDASLPETGWERRRPAAAWLMLGLWLLWLLQVMDRLPGQGLLEGLLAAAGEALAPLLPFWAPAQIAQILGGLLLQVGLPILLLRLVGLRGRDLGLSCRGWQVAAPVLLVYLALFVSSGVNGPALALLGYAALYPGLTEEFFYRGLMQRALTAWLRPGHALAAVALLFALLHVPGLLAGPHGESPALLLSRLASLTLYGLFIGYGFRRTGGLLPWILIHALSDAL